MKWRGREKSKNVIDKRNIQGRLKNRGRKNNGTGDRIDMMNDRSVEEVWAKRRIKVVAMPGKDWNTIGKSPSHGTGYGPRTRRTKAAIKKYGR